MERTTTGSGTGKNAQIARLYVCDERGKKFLRKREREYKIITYAAYAHC